MRCLTAHMVLPPAPSDGVFFIAPAVGEKHVVLTPRNTELCQQQPGSLEQKSPVGQHSRTSNPTEEAASPERPRLAGG